MIKNGYYIFRPWVAIMDNVRGEYEIVHLHYHNKRENAEKELAFKSKKKYECLSIINNGIEKIKVFT